MRHQSCTGLKLAQNEEEMYISEKAVEGSQFRKTNTK